jgi:hypothetical protein
MLECGADAVQLGLGGGNESQEALQFLTGVVVAVGTVVYLPSDPAGSDVAFRAMVEVLRMSWETAVAVDVLRLDV